MTRAHPRVEISVAADGSIRAHTVGVKGPDCLDYLPLLEDLLGAQTVRSAFTPEYHEVARETQRHEVRDELREE